MLLLGFFSLNPSDFFSELICWTNSFWNVLLLWLLWLHPLLVFPLFSWLIFLSLLWGLLCSTLNHCIPRAPSIIPFITLHILPGCSHPLIASTTIFIPMTLWSQGSPDLQGDTLSNLPSTQTIRNLSKMQIKTCHYAVTNQKMPLPWLKSFNGSNHIPLWLY